LNTDATTHTSSRPTVLITGITGTLGQALGKWYMDRDWTVIGVTRQTIDSLEACSRIVSNPQITAEDARTLAELAPDLVYLNAGAIETDIGPGGEPLTEALYTLTTVNYTFPAAFALEAAKSAKKPMDIICIGSIADGSPSCFGPLYHASKIALHYFVQGTAPILKHAHPHVTLRLYRPGAIFGPLSWAPVNRLNRRGHKIRAKRCENAPRADEVAAHIDAFRQSRRGIRKYDEPVSFRFLKLLFALAPDLYYRLQHFAWRKTNRFVNS